MSGYTTYSCTSNASVTVFFNIFSTSFKSALTNNMPNIFIIYHPVQSILLGYHLYHLVVLSYLQPLQMYHYLLLHKPTKSNNHLLKYQLQALLYYSNWYNS